MAVDYTRKRKCRNELERRNEKIDKSFEIFVEKVKLALHKYKKKRKRREREKKLPPSSSVFRYGIFLPDYREM